jgi:hypothetical protein
LSVLELGLTPAQNTFKASANIEEAQQTSSLHRGSSVETRFFHEWNSLPFSSNPVACPLADAGPTDTRVGERSPT